jgi:DNA invertase Pin-like site-specific DNA recombinase
MKKKAFSYIRMSSTRQLQGDSLARQLDLSEAFAANHDLELDTSLRDLGVSAFDGSNVENGALAVFLAKAKAGEIPRGSFLLVESLDRLSRGKVIHALRIFLDILEAGITIATVGDDYIYSQDSVGKDWTQLIISLAIMSRAHEESARKSQRLKASWVRKRENKSKKMTARAPSWLILSDDKKGFSIIPERAAIVERIFKELASGVGRDAIARRLNGDGIKPWGGGRQWHGGTVQKVTDNEAVIGRFQPRNTRKDLQAGRIKTIRSPVGEAIDDYYPAVISRALWLEARTASTARARSGPGNAGGRRGTIFSNLLSGMVYCDVCNSPMNYRDRGVRSSPVLRCSGERNGSCSNTSTIRYAIAEAKALETAMAYEPKWHPVEDQDLRERIAVEELRCQALDSAIERLLDALEAGEIQNARERLIEREEQRKEAKQALSAARQELEAALNEPSASGRRSILDEARRTCGLPPDQRFARRAAANQVLKDLQFQMRCKADGSIALLFPTINVEFRSPLPLNQLG